MRELQTRAHTQNPHIYIYIFTYEISSVFLCSVLKSPTKNIRRMQNENLNLYDVSFIFFFCFACYHHVYAAVARIRDAYRRISHLIYSSLYGRVEHAEEKSSRASG